jgi:RNA polymerase sigma-70 factor (ECF subfamily)
VWDNVRLAELFAAEYDFIWRSLRRLGVPEQAVDDAAQEVFILASRKLSAIQPGRERAWLYGAALRVASDARRGAARERRRQSPPEVLADLPSGLDPAELVEQKRAREVLDRVLWELPLEQRAVFTLYELEGLTTAEIAAVLEVPMGTVASRLRRARELFTASVGRLQARARRAGREEP